MHFIFVWRVAGLAWEYSLFSSMARGSWVDYGLFIYSSAYRHLHGHTLCSLDIL